MTEQETKDLQAKIDAAKATNAETKAAKEAEEALIAEAKELGIDVPEKKQTTATEKKEEKLGAEEKDEKNTGLTKDDIKDVITEVVTAIKDSSQPEEKKEPDVIYG